jgi:hypothetical protein
MYVAAVQLVIGDRHTLLLWLSSLPTLIDAYSGYCTYLLIAALENAERIAAERLKPKVSGDDPAVISHDSELRKRRTM